MVERIKIKRFWDIDENVGDELKTLVPSVTFKTRVRDDSIDGDNPYRWEDVTTWDLFAGKRVVLILSSWCIHSNMLDLSTSWFRMRSLLSLNLLESKISIVFRSTMRL